MEEKNKLNFLHYVCDGISAKGHMSLDYWITVPEFHDRIQYLIECGVTIDKQVVFETMRSLFLDYENTQDYTERKSHFNFGFARHAINQLWKSLTGENEIAIPYREDGWRIGD